MEADIAEICLHESRLEVGDAHSRLSHIDAQAVGDSFHGSLGGAVHIAAGISRVARHAAHIYHMALVALHHGRHYKASHSEQSLDVGINHSGPIIGVAFIFLFQAERQTGVIDEHIYGLPFRLERLDGSLSSLSVAHIESQRAHHHRLTASIHSLKFSLKCSQLIGAARSENKVITPKSKSARTSLTNATRSTRNKSNFFHFRSFFYVSGVNKYLMGQISPE